MTGSADLVEVGTTIGGSNELGGTSCGTQGGGSGAPERIYDFLAPVGGEYDIAVMGQNFSPLLHVRRDDCRGAYVACAVDPLGRSPQLTAVVPAGGRLAIIVDGNGSGRQGAFTLRIVRRRPDLTVQLAPANAVGFAGGRIDVAAEVSNVGTASTGAFTVAFTIASDPSLDNPVGGDFVGCPIADLMPGETVTCRPFNQLAVPAIQPADYFLGVEVDAGNSADEIDETNNVASQPFRVAAGLVPDQRVFRAADGAVYQVIVARPFDAQRDGLATGTEELVVNTIAAASNGVVGCAAVPNQDMSIAALAGAVSPSQVRPDISTIRRTGVLFPPTDVEAIAFDPAFGGRLTLGSGSGALTICADTPGCVTSALAQLRPLTEESGNVPRACAANDITTSACGFLPAVDAFAFDLRSTAGVCDDVDLVTAETTLCGLRPPDGFLLVAGAAIVLRHAAAAGTSYGVGYGALGIDTDGVNLADCAAGTVVDTRVEFDNLAP